MKLNRIICALITGALLVSVVGCGLVSKTPEAIASTPVAKVNGEVITKGEYQKLLDRYISSLNAQYGTGYDKSTEGAAAVASQKTSIIQNMETSVLLLQKAKELKLDSDTKKIDADVATQIESIKKDSFSDDDTKFQVGIKQAGYTLDTLKAEIRKNVIIQYVLDNINKSVPAVTDAEVQSYYDANKATITESPNTIRYSQIVVQTQAEADKVITRLNNKEDFAAIAKELSLDTYTKANGGDVGSDVAYTDPTVATAATAAQNVDATILAAAKKLKTGEVSAPISSQSAFFIIKLTSKKEYPVKALDSKVKDDINAYVLKQNQSKAQSKQIDTWTTAAKIETFTNEL